MQIFGSDDSCCFVEARLRGGPRGVRISFGGGSSDFGAEAIVTDVSFTQREKVSVLPCFNNKNYVYAFGHDAAASTVDITIMVSVCPESTAILTATERYRNNRASKGNIATITYGPLAIRGILVGLNSKTMDAKLNLQHVLYTFILVEPIGSK